ncbi:MAG: hypothetical protein HC773_26105 [Scytonema sp. CRU_2_7]|nr:hypothetical protein [Scytonema sp. CRU_2_7]
MLNGVKRSEASGDYRRRQRFYVLWTRYAYGTAAPIANPFVPSLCLGLRCPPGTLR